MPSRPRVLILNERDSRHPAAGGAEVHVQEIGQRLVERGFEITLFSSLFPGASERDELAGMRVRRLAKVPSYYLRAAQETRRETRSGNFDIVVEHLCKLPHLSPIYSQVPVVAVCHHLFGRTAFAQVPWPIAATVVGVEKLIPRLYRGLEFVAVSESTKQDLIRRGVRSERIRIVHNGIQTPRRAPRPWSERPVRVAYLGRLEPYKRVEWMFRALAPLVERFPKLEIVVIGRGKSEDALVREADALGLAQRTRFVGFVSDEERDEILADTRVCVCPSLKEGWGITVIEANALGVPVVASDAPGLHDAIQEGETGLLVPPDDLAGFTERIQSLLGDEARATRMAEHAARWSRNFTWDRAAQLMEAAIESARIRG